MIIITGALGVNSAASSSTDCWRACQPIRSALRCAIPTLPEFGDAWCARSPRRLRRR